MQDLREVSGRLEGCACSYGTPFMGLTSKTSHTLRLATLAYTLVQIVGGNGRWFSVRVYSLSLYLKRPTTRQQENARAPLATHGLNRDWSSTREQCMSPCACQDFPVTTIAELKSNFKHLSFQSISLVWGDAIRHQEVQQKSHFDCL